MNIMNGENRYIEI